jgi:hypothetical protein
MKTYTDMTTMELCNAWNEATAPYVPRTDDEHAAMRIVARACMAQLKVRGARLDELSNGMILPAGYLRDR